MTCIAKFQNWHMAQKYAFIKTAAIFPDFFETLSKWPPRYLVGYFDQVLKKLGKNCGFFDVSILGAHAVYWYNF